ncbi:MAG: hypothetical protein AAB783_01895 [Patescibacteria group bacterium]
MKEESLVHLLPSDMLEQTLEAQRGVSENLRDLHESLREAEKELELSATEKVEDERLYQEWVEFGKEMGFSQKESQSKSESSTKTEAHIMWLKDHIEQVRRLIESSEQLKKRFNEQIERLVKINQETLDILARSKSDKPN